MNITVTLNAEKQGIELRFSEKPDEEIRTAMKAKGFRYSRRQNLWYAKESEARLEFATDLTLQTAEPLPFKEPKPASTPAVAALWKALA